MKTLRLPSSICLVLLLSLMSANGSPQGLKKAKAPAQDARLLQQQMLDKLTTYPADPKDVVVEYVDALTSDLPDPNDPLVREAQYLKSEEGKRALGKVLNENVATGSEDEKLYRFRLLIKQLGVALSSNHQDATRSQVLALSANPPVTKGKCPFLLCVIRACSC